MAQILVAESDRSIREFIAGILNDFGHKVTVCEDSEEATAFLAIGSIDVVLTDLVLRSGEGSRLSDDCAARGVPTITLTGREFQPGQGDRERPTPPSTSPSGSQTCSASSMRWRSVPDPTGRAKP